MDVSALEWLLKWKKVTQDFDPCGLLLNQAREGVAIPVSFSLDPKTS